uniref:F-box/LRR-repeat protein 12-like n=1 Tax=Hirondellea gigas TaxID=1518452 RepID=A0A2P2IC47_9CRUS
MGNTTSQLTRIVGDKAADFTLPPDFFEGACYPQCSVQIIEISINSLPVEILLYIFSHFTVPEISRYILPVCTKWYNVGSDKSLWKSLKFGSGWAATKNFSASTIRRLIQQSPNLKTFEYHSNNYIARIIQTLAKYCPQLQTLEIQSKALTYRTVESLVINCPLITQLSLYRIEGNDYTKYMPLANLKNLRALEFSGCDWAVDELMLAMAKNCTKLQYLNLQSLSFLSDKSLSVLLSNSKGTLKTIMLCLWEITDKSFEQVAECTNLERLTIVPAVNISNSCFLKFQNLKRLETLTLSRLWSVSPSVCSAVFGHPNLKNLRDVDLVFADAVDNTVIKSLVQNALNLSVLSLERCTLITDDGMYSVVAWCKKLVYLNLEGMQGIHGTFLLGIDSTLPLLRVLRVDHCYMLEPAILKKILVRKKKSKLSVFTEVSHVYNEMESSLMRYPATHQARFQVNFGLLNVKNPGPFELSSYVFRKSIW